MKFNIKNKCLLFGKTFIALSLGLSCTFCAPKVYVIDRQTVLEEEAAGEWPEFDKDLLKKNSSAGAIPLGTAPLNARRARLYNVLNGNLENPTEFTQGTHK